MSSNDATSPVIVLLAAGEGSRFGGAKQLADVDGEPMVRRVARMLLETGVPVLVVTGAYADDVEAVLDDLPLSVVRCDDWQLGMGNSLAAGVRELMGMVPHASAALVALADQPLLDATAFQTLLERHRQAPDGVFATEHDGVQGPPALFPRDCFDALATLSGPKGARTLLQREAARLELIPANGIADVDTPDDLRLVRASLATPKPP